MEVYLPLLKEPHFAVLYDLVCTIDQSANKREVRYAEYKALEAIEKLGENKDLWRRFATTTTDLWRERIYEYNH